MTTKRNVIFILKQEEPYRTPLLRKISDRKDIELTVFYCEDFSSNIKVAYIYKRIKKTTPVIKIKLPNLPEENYFNPSIWKILSNNNFDVVIVGGYYHLTMLLAIFWALIHHIPYIINSESHFLTKRNIFKSFMKKLFLSPIIKRTSAYLPTGKYAGEYLIYYGADREKIFYFPNTPDVEYFIKESDEYRKKKKEIKRELGIENGFILLYIGRLVKEKGLFTLLKAFKEIKKNYKDLALLLVGDGILKNSLIEYVENDRIEDVYFTGAIPNNKLPKYYAISDIFVLPSYYEPWGVVVNEAMASGLPIILSDKVGSGGDLLKEGENGFSYKSDDSKELTSCIEKFIKNPKMILEMGNQSRKIIKKFDYSYCEENFNKAINKCIKDI